MPSSYTMSSTILYLLCLLEATRGQHIQQIGSKDYEQKPYNVSVDCGRDSLIVRVQCRRPFRGRLYVKDRYRDPSCSVVGDGSKSLSLTLNYRGSNCGLANMGNGTLATKVVIQRHPRILLKEDESYRIFCYFKMENTIVSNTLDVRGDLSPGALTSNNPPRVRLRILDQAGKEVTSAKMGDELILLIEFLDEVPYGIKVRDLMISSPADAHSITLVDSNGCIREPSVFPQLATQPSSKNLMGRFKAFRFPDDPVIRFRATISFCWNYCRPVLCPHSTEFGYGRKRRSLPDVRPQMLSRSKIISRTLPQDVTLEVAMVIEEKDPRHDDVSSNHVFHNSEVQFRPSNRNQLYVHAPVLPHWEDPRFVPSRPLTGGQPLTHYNPPNVPQRPQHVHRNEPFQNRGNKEFTSSSGSRRYYSTPSLPLRSQHVRPDESSPNLENRELISSGRSWKYYSQPGSMQRPQHVHRKEPSQNIANKEFISGGDPRMYYTPPSVPKQSQHVHGDEPSQNARNNEFTHNGGARVYHSPPSLPQRPQHVHRDGSSQNGEFIIVSRKLEIRNNNIH